MRKGIHRILGAAAVLCGGLLAVGALNPSFEAGVAVSDEMAATVKGGACGIEEIVCDLGDDCNMIQFRKDDGNTPGKAVDGNKVHCSGRLSCGECYTKDKDCT